MIDYTEIPDGEVWELFTREYLESCGFYIESPPSRGADGGKDLIVTERLKGRIGRYEFKWLVSCKHKATSQRSVSETDEPNILERMKAYKADGFIGFYSTIASSGLGTRLDNLKANGDIKDFKIMDGKYIENNLITGARSHLFINYLPKAYISVKPIHHVTDKYEPLECIVCGKDLLMASYKDERGGNIVFAEDLDKKRFEHIYCVCAGSCDRHYQRQLFDSQGLITSWHSLTDLMIPIEFLRYVMVALNRLRDKNDIYTDKAFKEEKAILIKLSQRVLRYTNEAEMERVKTLMSLPQF